MLSTPSIQNPPPVIILPKDRDVGDTLRQWFGRDTAAALYRCLCSRTYRTLHQINGRTVEVWWARSADIPMLMSEGYGACAMTDSISLLTHEMRCKRDAHYEILGKTASLLLHIRSRGDLLTTKYQGVTNLPYIAPIFVNDTYDSNEWLTVWGNILEYIPTLASEALLEISKNKLHGIRQEYEVRKAMNVHIVKLEKRNRLTHGLPKPILKQAGRVHSLVLEHP